MTQGIAPIDYNQPGAKLQVDRLRGLLSLGALGLLGGGGVAALQHLGSGTSNLKRPVTLPLSRSYIRVPVPEDDDEEPGGVKLAAAALAARVKRADGPRTDPTLVERAATGLGMVAPTAGPDTRSAFSQWAWPKNVLSRLDVPGYVGLAAPAAIGSAAAGHALASGVLGWKRRRDRQSEVAAARERFLQAITGKAAAEADAGGLEKDASLWNKLTGGMLALGLLSAMGTGSAAYGYARDHSRAKALRDALRQRREEMYEASPPPIIAMPAPYRPEKNPRPRALPPVKFANMTAAADGLLSKLHQRRDMHMRRMLEMRGLVDPKQQAAQAQEAPAPRPPSILPGAPAQPAGG